MVAPFQSSSTKALALEHGLRCANHSSVEAHPLLGQWERATSQYRHEEVRLQLTLLLMQSLSRRAREGLCEVLLEDLAAGAPLPPFIGVREDAEFWASTASLLELRAYLWAIWKHLLLDRRRAFLCVVGSPAEAQEAAWP